MHEGHKLFEVNDEESLKKENITIEASSNDFNEIIEKLKNLKDKIEKEIINLDESYDKVFNEVGKSYEKKHEKLILEEQNLKDQLQNEVTKIKEKLEEHLSESNKLIKDNERIQKGIKTIKKDEENIIRILTYVSKINKNKKNLNLFFSEFMENLKINFQEEENNIIYTQYYFNGIQKIKNIKFENVNFDNFKIVWEFDDTAFPEKEKNKIKYLIEIKEENKGEKLNKICEGNKNYFHLSNLNSNTNYEIKICVFFNKVEGPWSEKMKIKTLDFKSYCDSLILEESNRKIEFFNKINEWCKSKKLELLYRGSRDGSTSEAFHNKCDNKGETIRKNKNQSGYIFGGYNPTSWSKEGNWVQNNDCFLFTLTNVHNSEPTKFPHKKGQDSHKNSSDSGPKFDDIYIESNYKTSESSINFPRGYLDTLSLGKSIFTGFKDNKINSVKINEIEVFKIVK